MGFTIENFDVVSDLDYYISTNSSLDLDKLVGLLEAETGQRYFMWYPDKGFNEDELDEAYSKGCESGYDLDYDAGLGDGFKYSKYHSKGS